MKEAPQPSPEPFKTRERRKPRTKRGQDAKLGALNAPEKLSSLGSSGEPPPLKLRGKRPGQHGGQTPVYPAKGSESPAGATGQLRSDADLLTMLQLAKLMHQLLRSSDVSAARALYGEYIASWEKFFDVRKSRRSGRNE